jgi:catechol-2,3-dioxygenase
MPIPRAAYPTPFNITRASHAVLRVKDLGASRAFYVDALGRTVSEADARGQAPWCSLNCTISRGRVSMVAQNSSGVPTASLRRCLRRVNL